MDQFGEKKAIPEDCPHLGLLMMVKDEEKRILYSLKSILGVCKSIIIYDTGSTDRTIELIKEFALYHGLDAHIKQGKFVDFSTSRNVALEFADEIPNVDFLLLLDSNDELRNGHLLPTLCKTLNQSGQHIGAWLVTQEWWSGSITRYWNVRLIRPKNRWRYKEVVHEYIDRDGFADVRDRIDSQIFIYQDRTQDNDKSVPRFSRDYDLLKNDYLKQKEVERKDPGFKVSPRTIFYLAQTCACLKKYQEAYDFYQERALIKNVGFWEERFHAYLRSGDLVENSNWDLAMANYMKAWEVMPRAEVFVKLADHYRKKEEYQIAYTFAKLACDLKFPEHCILFVDGKMYDYTRWHLLSVVSFYVKDFELGRRACLKALESEHKNEVDINNLKFYSQKEAEIRNQAPNSGVPTVNPPTNPAPTVMTKNVFMNQKMAEIQKENPKMKPSQLKSRALLEWKKLKKHS